MRVLLPEPDSHSPYSYFPKRGLQWFDVDGELLALSDPIKYTSTRPASNPTYSPELETEYAKAICLADLTNNSSLGGNSNPRAVGSSVAKYRIDLDISQVQFSFHQLFSAEHVLAVRLRNMCAHYVLTQQQNLVEILTAKVNTLMIELYPVNTVLQRV